MNSKKSNKRELNYTFVDYEKVKRMTPNFYFPTPQHFHESALQQEFSLPMPIMKYIWSNPSSSKMYQKLIKWCKLFFLKNPIIVLKNLQYISNDGWRFCNSNGCYGAFSEYNRLRSDVLKNKLWIVDRFAVVTSQKSNLSSIFLAKLFRHNFTELTLTNQELSYNELKFLSTGVKEFSLNGNVIKYDKGEEVPLENVIKLFSGATYGLMNFGSAPGDIGCKNYDDFFDACKTVKEIKIFRIPLDFNVSDFYQHLKHCQNRSVIEISADNVYGQRDILKEIIKEILATKSFDFVPPVIKYSGNYADVKQMEIIQWMEAAKYR